MVKTKVKREKREEKAPEHRPKTLVVFFKRFGIPLIVLAFATLGFYIRYLPGTGKYFIDPDTYYHYEIYKLVLKEGLPRYYSMAEAPFGSLIGEPLGLYLLPAIFYKLISAFGYTTLQAFKLWPPTVGFLSIIATYLLARKIHGEWAGLWSAAIMSFLLAHFTRTFSGNARGDGPFLMLFLFASVAMLYYLEAKDVKRKMVYGTLFVALSVIALSAWNGSPFSLMVFLGFGALQAIVLFVFGRIEELREFIKLYYPTYLTVLLLGYLLTFPRIVAVKGHILFALKVFLGLAGLTVLMLYGGKWLNYSDRRHRFAVVAVVTLLGFVGAYIYVGPKLFSLMAGAYQSTQVYETVQELAKTTLGDIKAYYGIKGTDGIVFFMSLAGVLVLLYRYLTTLLREGRSSHEYLFALTLYGMSLYLVWSAVRFLFLASGAVILMAGVFAGELFRIIEDMKEKATTKITLGLALTVMLLLMPVTGVPLMINTAKAMKTSEVERSGWEDALMWLRENTSEYATATSWWDYGYWIESSLLGNRRASADGGHARDRDHILALFLARDGNVSEVDFESWELNYFIAYMQDWRKFNAISYLGGAITRREYKGDESGRGGVTTIVLLPGANGVYSNPYMGLTLRVENRTVKVNGYCEPMESVILPSNTHIKGSGQCETGSYFPYVAYVTPTFAVLAYYKVATSNFLKLAFGIPASKEANFTEKLYANFELVFQSGDVIVYEFKPFAVYKAEELVNGTWRAVETLTPGEHTLKLYISAFGRDVKNATLYVEALKDGKVVERIKVAEGLYIDHLNEKPIEVKVNLPEADEYRFVLVQKGPVGVLTSAPRVNGSIANPIKVLGEGQSGTLELKAAFDRDYTADLYLRVTFIYLVRKSGRSNDDIDAAFEPHMDTFFAAKLAEGLKLKKGEDTITVNAGLPAGVISSYEEKLKALYGDRLIIRGIRVEPVFIADKAYTIWEVRASAPHHGSE